MTTAIVWFKRDLRAEYHKPLRQAADQHDVVIPLYIFEPDLWQQPDMSYRHFLFLMESIEELHQTLSALGQGLVIRVGSAVDVLADITRAFNVKTIYSSQETWNNWTYQRDIAVSQWAKTTDVQWFELPQNGVVRALPSRDGWSKRWYQHVTETLPKPVKYLPPIAIASDTIGNPQTYGLVNDGIVKRQLGGRQKGLALLDSFLYERCYHYSHHISSPKLAQFSGSRLSPYLAFGCLSIAEVYQASNQRVSALKQEKTAESKRSIRSIQAFLSRLRWHCHFIQKMECQPDIEFHNMHRAYDSIRTELTHPEYLHAWQVGMTGYPMVDASMRSLIQEGWLNFRMRAMLMSFASYHLWIPWQMSSLHLANLFVDYEPGIHYSQTQMQSGTTGINTLRIYNPTKQAIDQDPDGSFIRHWIPELSAVEDAWIHEPWQAPEDCRQNYPLPIINESQSRQAAMKIIYGIRRDPKHRDLSTAIVTQHASRRKRVKPKTVKQPQQLALNLGLANE